MHLFPRASDPDTHDPEIPVVMRRPSNAPADVNKLLDADKPVHDWYRFVLSYPPHLVRHYLQDFGVRPGQLVLDPFSGTGTTVVECRKNGIQGVGIEANPMAFLASSVKSCWSVDPDLLLDTATKIARAANRCLVSDGVPDLALLEPDDAAPDLRSLPDDAASLLLADSISPRPLHKALVLVEKISAVADPNLRDALRVALARSLVNHSSNLHFGPEVGVGPAKPDAPVVAPWLDGVKRMARDLTDLADAGPAPILFHSDARNGLSRLQPASLHAVITSPPYPNEKDYTRTTRLESVLLGLMSNKADLKALKQHLVRSNTRNVYRHDTDDRWVEGHAEIERIAAEIEARRIALNKTSGFERMYARVTKLYFGGMKRHLAELRPALAPGAKLAYVVGDQASYLRVMIRTGDLLGDLATSLGYRVLRKDLFRTRLATATREQLREEALILQWPG